MPAPRTLRRIRVALLVLVLVVGVSVTLTFLRARSAVTTIITTEDAATIACVAGLTGEAAGPAAAP